MENVSLEINKGQNIGIIGSTGVGKSTLTDIILGLVKPSFGYIYIDDKILESEKILDWNRKISHVPQNIYLLDDSIVNNIICFVFSLFRLTFFFKEFLILIISFFSIE